MTKRIGIELLGFRDRDWAPYLVYALLSLAILSPLLAPGYILALDMIPGPKINTSQFYGLSEGNFSIISLWAAIFIISKIIPMWLLQKFILFLILFLAGLGAHRLLPSKGLGNYFAGLLYTVNPFVYARFLAGQWTLLAGYALMPFAIKAFLGLLEKGNGKNAIKVAVFSTLVVIFTMHGFFLLLMVFFIIFLVKVIKERKRPVRTILASKYAGISAGLLLFLNLYWLIPFLTGGEAIMEQISTQDLLFFAPKATSRIMFDVASMHGFWRGGYIYAKDILPFWWVLFLFILFLAVYGFTSRVTSTQLPSPTQDNADQGSLRRALPPVDTSVQHRWVGVSFGIIWIASLLLAVGAAAQPTTPAFEWLWAHFPFFKGFRDSQKFVILLCLAYAYLGGLGVNVFAKELKQLGKGLAKIGMVTLVVLALLTPLVYSFTMFGFHEQVGATDYPQEWYEVNNYLNRDNGDFNVLFLPWHMYMDFSWLPNKDKRLANPAQQFFDKPVIAGDNLEMPGVYSQSTNPISKYVEFLLANQKNIDNLGELLAPLNVKYIILVHETDYTDYDFLYHQRDLKVELDQQGLTVFKNQHSLARIYGADSVVYIKSLDEYLKLSHEQDVMQHLYILGNGANTVGDGELTTPSVTEKSPVKYQVGGTASKYIVFTVPQNVSTEHWEYNSKQPLKNLGFMPAFESVKEGGEIVYTRFHRVYLPSYVASAAMLILLMVPCSIWAKVKVFSFRRKMTK